jgi:tripartite motif-containing protein 71
MNLGLAARLSIAALILVGSISSSSFALSATGANAEHYILITKWGSPGTANGEFSGVEGIGVDALGHIYVVDRGNDRIEKFDSNGTFITAWGSPGTANGQFNSPEGITVDASGDVYIADHGNDRIEKFDSNGTFITAWGSHGINNGLFREVAGVTVDSGGHVYVSDYGDNTVKVFGLGANSLVAS